MLRRRSEPADSFESNLSASLVLKGGLRTWLKATLRFDKADPFVVRVSLRNPDSSGSELRAWSISRDLLSEGRHGPVGTGWVKAKPGVGGGRRTLAMALGPPDDRTDLELPRSRVATFLRETYAVVPAGMEGDGIDWDNELSDLLGSDSS